MSSSTGPFSNDQLQSALAAVWEKSLPLLRHRVTVLGRAVEQLSAGRLEDALHSEAKNEAHRMAGLLGTFGHPEGTDAARMLELALDHEQAGPAASVLPSPQVTAELRRAVELLQRIVR